MIKSVTQYIVVCDNSFCDAVHKSVVDFHSYDRQQQFEGKIKKLGWKVREDENKTGPKKRYLSKLFAFCFRARKKDRRFQAQ